MECADLSQSERFEVDSSQIVQPGIHNQLRAPVGVAGYGTLDRASVADSFYRVEGNLRAFKTRNVKPETRNAKRLLAKPRLLRR